MNMWTSCVDGIPDGINVAIGEPVSDAFTCFCSEELCNVEHFCDDCVVESTFTVTAGKWTTDTTTPDWTATTTRTSGDRTNTTQITGEWTTATWTTDTTTPDWTASTTRTTPTTTTVLSTTSHPINGCPYGWVNSLEGCFLFHHEENTTWRDAQEECEWLGGFLAEPKSEEQITFLVRKS